MKTFIVTAVSLVTCLSCNKKESPAPVENSNQLLMRILKTADFGGGTYSLDLKYNDAGKIIREDNTTYNRDAKQRIVSISSSGRPADSPYVYVYYKDETSTQVDYTFSKFSYSNSTDSAVYIHDKDGKLIKTMGYYQDLNDSKALPMLSHYMLLNYDDRGNLIQVDIYTINDNALYHCSAYYFDHYDAKINPLHTDDEVRISNVSWAGILNSSTNNCKSIGIYTKSFEYRADGRPKTCIIKQNGANSMKLIYEYQ